MTFLFSLLTNNSPYLDIPQSLVGRLIAGVCWLLGLALLALFLSHWRAYHRPRNTRFWVTLAVLAAFVLITALFIGVRLPSGGALPLPGIPIDRLGPVNMMAIAMGLQAVVGQLGSLSTIVFTTTLTRLVGGLYEAMASGHTAGLKEVKTQIMLLASYVAGAVLAGLLAVHGIKAVATVPPAAVLVALTANGLLRRGT